MHRTFSMILASVVALLPLASASWADSVRQVGKNLTEVTVTGAGMTKDDATRDAMRKAVERGAGTYIHSQSETRDFTLVKDTVLARSTGFIQKHKILRAKETEEGTWEVTVKATVSIQGVVDAWGTVTTLLKQMGRPKIMVFVTEKVNNRTESDSTVQARIENLLLKSGFLLVNKEQLKAIDQKELTAAVAEDNAAKVQAIAKRFGAQLFISGTAIAQSGRRTNVAGLSLHTYQADANIKCYRADTAQLLSSIPGSPTRGADRVARSAAKKALDFQAQQIAPKVQNDILRFWQDALAGRGEVQLKVEGIKFTQYVKIKKALKKIDEVKDVTARFSNGIADCSIESSVKAETLAEKIVEVLEQLEITDVSQNVIRAKWTE